jgi:hypothetical protein
MDPVFHQGSLKGIFFIFGCCWVFRKEQRGGRPSKIHPLVLAKTCLCKSLSEGKSKRYPCRRDCATTRGQSSYLQSCLSGWVTELFNLSVDVTLSALATNSCVENSCVLWML